MFAITSFTEDFAMYLKANSPGYFTISYILYIENLPLKFGPISIQHEMNFTMKKFMFWSATLQLYFSGLETLAPNLKNQTKKATLQWSSFPRKPLETRTGLFESRLTLTQG